MRALIVGVAEVVVVVVIVVVIIVVVVKVVVVVEKSLAKTDLRSYQRNQDGVTCHVYFG